jgi:gluconate 2-dehydrogenase gamma chain
MRAVSTLSRRNFVAALGTGAATVWLTAEARDLLAAGQRAAAAAQAQTPFKILTADQAAELDAATSRIVPSDGTPGAREANIVRFIDESLAGYGKDQRDEVTKLVTDLRRLAAERRKGTKSFATLSPVDQDAVIATMEKTKGSRFGLLRAVTVTGMFANPEYGGNANKNGWKLLGFDDHFSWAAPFGWYDRNV